MSCFPHIQTIQRRSLWVAARRQPYLRVAEIVGCAGHNAPATAVEEREDLGFSTSRALLARPGLFLWYSVHFEHSAHTSLYRHAHRHCRARREYASTCLRVCRARFIEAPMFSTRRTHCCTIRCVSPVRRKKVKKCGAILSTRVNRPIKGHPPNKGQFFQNIIYRRYHHGKLFCFFFMLLWTSPFI